MCGIAGFQLSPTDTLTVNSKRLARDLLLGIEHRGTDATGFAFADSTGRHQIHKRAVPASDFVRRGLCLPKRTETAILHTRAWTTGSPTINDNNHPIASGNIVGVHNGWLTNTERLWGDIVNRERQLAEVDSEVIFAMLANGYADSGATVLDSLEAIRGNAAVAWLDLDTPGNLYLARGHSSPLFIGQTQGGSIVFASESDVVALAASAAGLELTHIREAVEGSLFTVSGGEVIDVRNFKPEGPGYGRARNIYASWDDESYAEYESTTRYGVKSAAKSARVFVENLRDIDGEDIVTEDNFWSLDWLSRSLFDVKTPIPFSNGDAYYTAYDKRERIITQWFQNYRGPVEQRAAAERTLKANVHPGDYVTTYLGDENYPAQVVAVPDQWPTGKYALRVYLKKRMHGPASFTGTDVALVERNYDEFVPVPKTVTSLPKATHVAEALPF